MKRDPELRQKYLDALEKLEAGEARWAKLENVMKLTVGRLSLAARGRSPRLDQELGVLAKVMRSHPEPQEIEACLEPLSRAIAGLDELPAAEPARPAAGSPVAGSPVAGSPVAGSSAGSPAAVGTADPIPHPHAAGAGQSRPQDAGAREERIHAAILAMLERLASLPELRSAVAELQERSLRELSAGEVADAMERVARLLQEQRAALQREKLELEEVLRQADARLEEVASYLAGEASVHQSAADSSRQLNLLVMDEVHELNSDVQRSADIAELRVRVRTRLEAITTHLQDFRVREEERSASQLDRTGRMRVRIADLERESRQLAERLQEEQRLAMVDALTGIGNRAAYDERIEHEFLRFQRHGLPVSILAWDVDRFKHVNDAYGHKAGDKVLRVVAQHLAQHVRGTDFVARYGGEEFVMILVGTSAEQALVAADKIRDGIARIGFHFRNKPVAVTASCGITTFRATDTPDEAFGRADRALYAAKEAGRNCCRIG